MGRFGDGDEEVVEVEVEDADAGTFLFFFFFSLFFFFLLSSFHPPFALFAPCPHFHPHTPRISQRRFMIPLARVM